MSVAKTIADFLADRDFAKASDIATFLFSQVEEELGVTVATESPLARPIIYRGAVTTARDVLKKPRMVAALIEDAEQGELYEEFSEMVWIGEDEEGLSLFGRRRALTREQYQAALDLLREKATQLRAKIERYQEDFDRASPHWRAGMTFGVAIALAARSHSRLVHA